MIVQTTACWGAGKASQSLHPIRSSPPGADCPAGKQKSVVIITHLSGLFYGKNCIKLGWCLKNHTTRKQWLQLHRPSRYLFNSNAAIAFRRQSFPLLGWTSPGRVQGLSGACAASLQGLEGREGARWPQSSDCRPSACSRPGAEPTLTQSSDCRPGACSSPGDESTPTPEVSRVIPLFCASGRDGSGRFQSFLKSHS